MVDVEFDRAWLGAFLDSVGQRWEIGPMGQWSPGKSMAILRHDVDLDLELASSMAAWERERGIRSTYFILTTSDCYNPFSASGRHQIRAIEDEGGEIGLHLDVTQCPSEELHEVAHMEAARLGRISRHPVRTLSLHCPHRLEQLPLIDGFMNAYDPRIFGPDRYISDSSRRFRRDPLAFLEQAPDTIQILIHPLHFEQPGKAYPEIFREYFWRHMQRVDDEHRPVNENFRASFSGLLPTLYGQAQTPG